MSQNQTRILTEKDIDSLEKRFKQVFVTQNQFTKYRSEILNRLDKILKEIVSMREEKTVSAYKTSGLENRLDKLEAIHPQGLHQAQ